MVLFEDLSFPDAVWLSITTITTVGYGDFSAATFMGRVDDLLDVFAHDIVLAGLEGADVDDHVNFSGAVPQRPPGLERLYVCGSCTQGKSDDGARLDV